MKKILIFLSALLPILILSSCNPEKDKTNVKHLAKLYTEEDGEKTLVYGFIWNKDRLEKMEGYFNDKVITTFTLSYNKDNKVSHMEMYQEFMGQVNEIIYDVEYKDGKMIIRGYMDEELYNVYSYTYNQEKVTRIDVSYYFPTEESMAPAKDLERFLGIPSYNEQMAQTGRKGTQEISYFYIYEWTGDNITKVTNSNGEISMVSEFTFDKANNPYYNVFMASSYLGVNQCSKNNVLTQTDEEGTVEFQYNYDKDDYPVRQVSVDDGSVVIFEYAE